MWWHYESISTFKFMDYYLCLGSKEMLKNKKFASNEILVTSGKEMDSFATLITYGKDPIYGDYLKTCMEAIFRKTKGIKNKSTHRSYFTETFYKDPVLVIEMSGDERIYSIPFDNEAYELIKKEFNGKDKIQLGIPSLEDCIPIYEKLWEIADKLIEKRRNK
jgi:hypothetical protein